MILLLLMGIAHAQLDLQPHSAAIPSDKRIEQKSVVTHERDVVIDGTSFRQYEVNGEYFQVRLDHPESYTDCTRIALPANTYLFEASAKVTKRTALFVNGLRAHCGDPHTQGVTVDPQERDGNLGVKFAPEKPGGSEKKIMVNPFKKSTTFQSTF